MNTNSTLTLLPLYSITIVTIMSIFTTLTKMIHLPTSCNKSFESSYWRMGTFIRYGEKLHIGDSGSGEKLLEDKK